jgi:hypothetical protein
VVEVPLVGYGAKPHGEMKAKTAKRLFATDRVSCRDSFNLHNTKVAVIVITRPQNVSRETFQKSGI